MGRGRKGRGLQTTSGDRSEHGEIANKHEKLSRLPPTNKISKRPLLHAPIPSPRTSSASPKIIYISSSTPFISILKRVRKLLSFVEDRASGSIKLTRDGRDTFRLIEKAVRTGGDGGNGEKRPRDEEVQIRATGKAIGKAMNVAVRLGQEEGWKVRFETGSVGAVDDVVERRRPKVEKRKKNADKEVVGETLVGGEEGTEEEEEEEEKMEGKEEKDEDVDMNEGDTEARDLDSEQLGQEEGDIEESRVRYVSCFIIYVGLR